MPIHAPRLVPFAVLMACLAGAATAALPEAVPGEEEHLVDGGTYRLFFRIIRGEGPVVLLEAGGGMDSSEWKDIPPLIAETTGATVVTYDRPGFGRSDLPGIP